MDSAGAVLREAALLARVRQFRVSSHARQRMLERNAKIVDICHALMTSTSAEKQAPSKWRLSGGTDESGVALELVVLFESGALIVTVI